MSETLETPKFLEFKVLKEPWNEYQLGDGTTLRIKVVVISFIEEDSKTVSIQTKNVIGVRPNPKFMGLPSPPLKPGEELESYKAEDCEIVDKEERWNEYILPEKKMRLKVKGVLVQTARTSRHDEKGMPIYLANIQCLIKHIKENS